MKSDIEVVRPETVRVEVAEVAQQLEAAKRWPRDLRRVAQMLVDVVTLDEQAAAECVFALPPRGGGGGAGAKSDLVRRAAASAASDVRRPIIGPSVRLAEAAATLYGNCRVASRPTEINRSEKYVEAQATFWDLETNCGLMAAARRRISDGAGRIYSDDMIMMTAAAACSVARRNVILAGVPRPVWWRAYEAALATLRGTSATVAERRAKAVEAFRALGVETPMLFAALGVGSVEDITPDHLVTLAGMHSALRAGEVTIDEMFGAARLSAAPSEAASPLGPLGPLAEETTND